MHVQQPPRVHTREELEEYADLYLAALVAHDPSRLPTTDDVTFSENDQALALGEGSWATVSGLGTYRHLFADPRAGRVGFIGTVREHGVPAILDFWLQVRDGHVAAVEALFIRDALGARRLEELGAPEDVWLTPVPESERADREALTAAALRYLAEMERNDGTGDYSFFDPECNRIEHGLQTTNVKKPAAYGHSEDVEFSSMTAEQQWKTGFLGFVTEIRSRRILVVDEERQAVLLAATLDHDGTVRSIDLTTGKTFTIPPYFDVPRTLQVMEAFRARGGRLYRIEMTLTEVPYGTRPPADPESADPPRDPVGSEARAETVAGAEQAVARTRDAMLAGDPATLPLAPGARYTENGQPLPIGEGLWRTLSGHAGGAGESDRAPGAHLTLRDPDGGQAAWWGGIVEHTTPSMLALRVATAAGAITEIEAVVVREEFMNERYGTITLFQPRLLAPFAADAFSESHAALSAPVPPDERVSAAEAAALADAWFDAIARDDASGVAIDPAARRRENGRMTTHDPDAPALDPAADGYRPFALDASGLVDSGFFSRVAAVRGLHHVVDEEQGLVLSIAALDIPGTVMSVEADGASASYPGLAVADASEPSEDVLFSSRLDANMVVPVTELTVQLTKVRGGRIVHLETLTRGAPHGLLIGAHS